MHSVLWLARDLDDHDIAIQAVRAGVAVRPVSPLFSEGKGQPGLILGLGAFPVEQMHSAMLTLAKIIKKAASETGAVRKSSRA